MGRPALTGGSDISDQTEMSMFAKGKKYVSEHKVASAIGAVAIVGVVGVVIWQVLKDGFSVAAHIDAGTETIITHGQTLRAVPNTQHRVDADEIEDI